VVPLAVGMPDQQFVVVCLVVEFPAFDEVVDGGQVMAGLMEYNHPLTNDRRAALASTTLGNHVYSYMNM
jgi:hypothetical protein